MLRSIEITGKLTALNDGREFQWCSEAAYRRMIHRNYHSEAARTAFKTGWAKGLMILTEWDTATLASELDKPSD